MVILIEDEPHLLELLATEMRLLNLASASFDCFRAALPHLATANNLRLILADIGAADGGMPLLQYLRTREAFVPVIFFSGNQHVDQRSLFAQGCSGYFPKPFSRAALLQRVRHAMALRTQPWSDDPAVSACEREVHIEDNNTVLWGHEGFTLNHTRLASPPPRDPCKFIFTLPEIQLLASPVWHTSKESGWIIERVNQGTAGVLAQTSAVSPWISIPYTSLL
jgi:DNA-binding response OmpR family regulator